MKTLLNIMVVCVLTLLTWNLPQSATAQPSLTTSLHAPTVDIQEDFD